MLRAARQTGCLVIQNRGTIGGNIANPCPVLLAYDASLLLRSASGQLAEDQILSGQPWYLHEFQPITNQRSTAEYRTQVAYNLMRDFIQSLNQK